MYQILLLCLFLSWAAASPPGPAHRATKGEVWPKVQKQQYSSEYMTLRPRQFRFQAKPTTGCPIFLDDAFHRYWTILAAASSLDRRSRFREIKTKQKNFHTVDGNYLGDLTTLSVSIDECTDDAIPAFDTLVIAKDDSILKASTIWGALRGLETFSQLVYFEDDSLFINVTSITDGPRFAHRGILMDTARHFMPLYIIYQVLDAMAYNKFNVFHWHLTDDQSFPYQSLTFPELSDKGAYHPVSKIYQQTDIRKVIEYARLRGIRVIPEFDTPGHTTSWGLSHPELLTSCQVIDYPLGPMNPTRNTTYEFLQKLFKEVVEVFPDNYFHIGGDEVDYSCWQNSTEVSDFMQAYSLKTYQEVEGYFIQKVVNILNDLKANYLVWEEVFVNGATLPNDTVVHVWRSFGENSLDVLKSVVEAGKYGIYSSCWYLDYLQIGGDWEKYYKCEPLDFDASDEAKKLVLGGEACMWAESVNEYNVLPRMWPRASAAAERLWSAKEVNSTDAAIGRLEEHTCRMNHRGIPAQPANGPGVCL